VLPVVAGARHARRLKFAYIVGDREFPAAKVKAGNGCASSCVWFCVMALAFLTSPPAAVARRPLTEDDAVDIWIARWLNIRRRDLIRRYECDPRRLYEIWEGSKFPAARDKALDLFARRYPTLLDRVDFGPHRRVPREIHPGQLSLFADAAAAAR
jgi:hypothetical protein